MNPIFDTLNDRQCEAVKHTEGPLLITAGAGSGKTKVLTPFACGAFTELFFKDVVNECFSKGMVTF